MKHPKKQNAITDQMVESKFNLSARANLARAAALSKELNRLKAVTAITVAGFSLLDLFLYVSPVTSVNYNDSQAVIAIICLACAIMPILLACMAAYFVKRARYADEKRAGLVVAAGLSLASTIALIVFGWNVRQEYYGNDTVGLFLNVLAVAAAVAAFIVEFVCAERRIFAKAELDAVQAETEALKYLDWLSQYTKTSEVDEVRRKVDLDAYLGKCRSVVNQGLDASYRAREILANRIAKTPDDREVALSAPFRIGPEEVNEQTKAAVFSHVYQSLGGPSAFDATADYHDPANDEYFDEVQMKAVAAADNRLRKIQGIGVCADEVFAVGSGEAFSSTAAPIQVDPVYS